MLQRGRSRSPTKSSENADDQSTPPSSIFKTGDKTGGRAFEVYDTKADKKVRISIP